MQPARPRASWLLAASSSSHRRRTPARSTRREDDPYAALDAPDGQASVIGKKGVLSEDGDEFAPPRRAASEGDAGPATRPQEAPDAPDGQTDASADEADHASGGPSSARSTQAEVGVGRLPPIADEADHARPERPSIMSWQRRSILSSQPAASGAGMHAGGAGGGSPRGAASSGDVGEQPRAAATTRVDAEVASDEPRPGGREEDVVMSKLHAHGLMLEEILRRLPPAPGGEGGRRPGVLPAPGPPRAVFPRGGGEQQKGSPEGRSNCDSEAATNRRTGSERSGGSSGPALASARCEPKSRFAGAIASFKSVFALCLKPQRISVHSLFHHIPDSTPGGQASATIHQLVMTPAFDLFFGLLIFVNTLFMAVEIQYQGAQLGHELGFYTFYGSDEWADSNYNKLLFDICEVIFATLFTVEVILRMVGMGSMYFRRPAEYFDLAVVVLSDISIVFSISRVLEHVQLMRLLRAAKLLRLLKLVRHIEGFDALNLMTTAIQSSVHALFWSVLLLMSILSFIAMIATEIFRIAYLEEDNLSDTDKVQLFTYWGTYTRSMLSLFELALANWPPICRWLMENLHEGFMVAALSFKLVMGIAVVGVINAVFMQETFKIASTDDETMVRMKERAARQHRHKMEELFLAADSDGSGRINRSEFRTIMKDASIRAWLASMDIVASDADVVFDLLSGEDEWIEKSELVNGINDLKGAARSIDMRRLLQAMQANNQIRMYEKV